MSINSLRNDVVVRATELSWKEAERARQTRLQKKADLKAAYNAASGFIQGLEALKQVPHPRFRGVRYSVKEQDGEIIIKTNVQAVLPPCTTCIMNSADGESHDDKVKMMFVVNAAGIVSVPSGDSHCRPNPYAGIYTVDTALALVSKRAAVTGRIRL